MTRIALIVALALLLGLGAGFWLGQQRVAPDETPPANAERKPLYYRHPMNPAITSPTPAKDEMGMDYVPVYEDQASPPPGGDRTAPSDLKKERKILYYRNPMGLPDTSPVPKKDSMGMDYLPVYADDEESAHPLRVSTEKIQRLGVKTAPAENADLARTVRSLGLVEADERRLYTVTLRFDGFIEKLHVNATGQSVARGQPLFELYSPDLITAQREYLSAKNAQAALSPSEAWVSSGMKALAESSLERLRNWGISESELATLEQGQVRRTLVVRSPASGVVLEKSVVAGARAVAGEPLFKIADLSRVWVIAEVYEQDIGLIEPGQGVQARLDAYPGRSFEGKVEFIYPTLNPATRTARVRIELPNPKGLLKPMMYARLEIAAKARRALTVPRSAVLESGRRTLVLVDRGEGRFEPREVKLGLRGEERVEILEGLRDREQVVVSANFLIDAESNLKAALGGFGPAGSGTEESSQRSPEERLQWDSATPPEPPPAGGHADHGGK
jgi:Cu(I)/Ag(I) efflux system membrane fusion protein